jgi:chemotaxis signal transduction protein
MNGTAMNGTSTMNGIGQPAERSFVVFQMESRRFALPAGDIVELAPPVRLHAFPHTMPLLKGVIVRRGHIVPVHDAAVLGVHHAAAHRFFLIARNGASNAAELAAIPVAGECELVSGELQPATSRPAYVLGTLAIDGQSIDVQDGETIEILDMGKLVASIPSSSEARS